MRFEGILKAYELSGGKPEDLRSKGTASLIVEGNKILDSNVVEGIIVEKEETETGVKVRIIVKKGQTIKKPIHLCFGVLPEEGLQEIISEITIEENASADIKACCTFPNARKVKHVMNAKFILERNSSLSYQETHFHGPYGGIEVIPKVRMIVNENSILKTNFSLITGRVGKLDIDYGVDAKKNSITEILTKVYGKDNDEIKIKEGIRLNGENARGVIKSRIAVKDNATSEVTNITEGNAPYTRGHVDCIEIIRDNAKTRAIPIVSVKNETAKVTHEAAIGTIDKKELETLMAHGLERDNAVNIIIEGILR
ncbi:MAG: SufD family Fe-S cluster assembly protein [Candidatus Altiarchaeales archaeon]|nr:MAG: SufD family Fe-S cluster assembly protein [Candidatus Altiarchaeales archaeon]